MFRMLSVSEGRFAVDALLDIAIPGQSLPQGQGQGYEGQSSHGTGVRNTYTHEWVVAERLA